MPDNSKHRIDIPPPAKPWRTMKQFMHDHELENRGDFVPGDTQRLVVFWNWYDIWGHRLGRAQVRALLVAVSKRTVQS